MLLIFSPAAASQGLEVTARRHDVALGPRPVGATPQELRASIERLQRLLRDGSRPARGQLLRLTDELGDQLLGPVADALVGVDRVLVRSAPELEALPFAALRLPRSVDARRGLLVEHAEICHLTADSRSSSPALRGEGMGEGVTVGAADPEHRPVERPLGASMSDAGVSWRRSAARRLEVRALADAFPDTRLLVGRELTAEALSGLAALSVLHLATDIRLGDRNSALVTLSSGDPSAPPRTTRIESLANTLSSPDGLAVISGLALEPETRLRGEENARNFLADLEESTAPLASLARSLEGAGFADVLISLWQAPDDTAPALFRAFYDRLSAGETAAGALRAAQRELIESPVDVGGSKRVDAREPVYWAGYRLYSNCR